MQWLTESKQKDVWWVDNNNNGCQKVFGQWLLLHSYGTSIRKLLIKVPAIRKQFYSAEPMPLCPARIGKFKEADFLAQSC